MDQASEKARVDESCRSSQTARDSTQDLEASSGEQQGHDEKTDTKDPDLIDWDGPDDPEHPQNWNFWLKVHVTLALAITNLIVAIASSIFGSGSTLIAEEFHVGHEVTVLGTSLFLIVSAIQYTNNDTHPVM